MLLGHCTCRQSAGGRQEGGKIGHGDDGSGLGGGLAEAASRFYPPFQALESNIGRLSSAPAKQLAQDHRGSALVKGTELLLFQRDLLTASSALQDTVVTFSEPLYCGMEARDGIGPFVSLSVNKDEH